MKFLIVICIIFVLKPIEMPIKQSYCAKTKSSVTPVAAAENENCPINEHREAVINQLYNGIRGTEGENFCQGYNNAIVAAKDCANALLASKGGVPQGNQYDDMITAAKVGLGNNTNNLRIKAIFEALKIGLQNGAASLPTDHEY